MTKQRERTRCDECGSTLIYIRVKTGERVCRQCGHIEKLKLKEEEKSEDE